MLHDTLPVEQCPFTWLNESRIATARRRAGRGEIAPPLLAAYGVDPDPQRTAYYRLLWDLDP